MEYRYLNESEITRDLFNEFVRHQEVRECLRREGCKWVIREDPFIDDWNDEDYDKLIKELKYTLKRGGWVYAGFCKGKLKAFVSLDPGISQDENRYMDMTNIYVSEDMRRKGIGKILFNEAKKRAGKSGAFKLYISAHSAVESQEFYKAMGCVEAEKYNMAHVKKEPYDCQLECSVK